MSNQQKYYVPSSSAWPFFGSVGIFIMMIGLAEWLHNNHWAPYIFIVGFVVLGWVLFDWFRGLISENKQGLLNNDSMSSSFRWAIVWMLFCEAMFFLVFFGALFYTRVLSVPWLGGAGSGWFTHLLIWPSFHASWPVIKMPNPTIFTVPHSSIEPWRGPAISTLLLALSGLTVTIAQWGLVKRRQWQIVFGLTLTIVLAILFLVMQYNEYGNAYLNENLKLTSGVYGATFYALTGVHALHIVVGIIMLAVVIRRVVRGDFKQDKFGFDAISWYWHFVDFMWLAMFIFVYWI